jgi:hypothetical protein
VDSVIDLRLRWLPVHDECPPEDGLPISTHDLRNAVTAVIGAARLLHERWDDLEDQKRRELTAMILRRAEQLRLVVNPDPAVV